MSNESTLFFGELDGKVVVKNLIPKGSSPELAANLVVKQFGILGDSLGRLAFNVETTAKNLLESRLSLNGRGNELLAQGNIRLGDAGLQLDQTLKVDPLNMINFQSLAFGQVSDLDGRLRGELAITGTIDNLNINGQLNTEDLGMTVTYLNNYFTINNEPIIFTDEGIALDSFTLIDLNNKEAVIDGQAFTSDYTFYEFDLNVLTDEFTILNTTEEDNSLYYGKVIATSQILVGGNSNVPEVDMEATLEAGSTLTYVIPQEELEAVQREGIVEIIDFSNPFATGSRLSDFRDSLQNELVGLDFDMTLTIDPQAQLTLVIDPATGDRLEVSGEGILDYSMSPTGEMTLAGTYVLNDGSYVFTFSNVFRREFFIKEGSSITWTGDPFNANINITATYTAEAAPAGLVAQQVADAQALNRYRRSEEFIVELQMDGQLLQPNIKFNIAAAEDSNIDNAVQVELARLRSDPGEMNKQVFALLILGGFISSGPSEDTDLLATTANSSISRILGSQLNNLSDKYIRFVDLDVNLESYQGYANGGMQNVTELQLALSKRFLNDRLIVRVGNNFNIGDDAAAANEGQRQATPIGDFTLEYLITPRGTYRLRAFQRNTYDGLMDSQLVETGVALIFSKEFNNLSEFFSR